MTKEIPEAMRPLDIFSEKNSLRDSNPDKIAASSSMAFEAHHSLSTQIQLGKNDGKHDLHDEKDARAKVDGDFNSAMGFGKRDQMALASLAFCSPLMMLGMGAAMGISDTIRMNKEQDLKEAPGRALKLAALERAAVQAADISKEKAKHADSVIDAVIKNTPPPETTASKLNLRMEPSARKKKLEFKNREQNVLYPSAWREKQDVDKSWVKASKLVKRKQQMMDQLAKCRGVLQLNVVSAILSKIEKLDKELKKMGC